MSERKIGEVHAKFRCLRVTHDYSGCHSAHLAPIYAEEGAPENKAYFEATPCGHADVEMGSECMFEPNEAYYIDMDMLGLDGEVKWADGHYRLKEVIDQGNNIVVELGSGWGGPGTTESKGIWRGKVVMTIDNQKAWPHFVGKVGSIWKVTYSEAPA